MAIIVVLDRKEKLWTEIPGVDVVTARSYLTDPKYADLKRAKVFNLCGSYRYQQAGYYVSLLATARGHRTLPDITTIQDIKTHSIIKIKSEDLEDVIQRSLHNVRDNTFTVNVYFGKSQSPELKSLAHQLFRHFHAPLLRANFLKVKDKWHLHNVELLTTSDLPDHDYHDVMECAKDFFQNGSFHLKAPVPHAYNIAILVNPEEKLPPSNEAALKKFMRAAETLGLGAWLITPEDYQHLGEYDALFIRETTNVNHHTYRFSRRAEVEGLVVIDDHESILKCSNKVYLAELLQRNNVPTPRTLVFGRSNIQDLYISFKFPFILKLPDSSFSCGVYKVSNEHELEHLLQKMFSKSELLIAQEFLPSEFDWRIGVLNTKPLFACKYYMANKHWQIINDNAKGNYRYGKVDTYPVDQVPPRVLDAALKACKLIGDGLYGVDVKEINGKSYVIEVNDNPNIEAGFEDNVLKNDLYLEVMKVFLERIRLKKEKL